MGTTPVHLNGGEQYRSVIRCIHLLPTFDRLGLALLLKAPYGSVSRIMAELTNEGYIELVKEDGKAVTNHYKKKEFYPNTDLWIRRKKKNGNKKATGRLQLNWIYGKEGKSSEKPQATMKVYRKSATFGRFLKRWKKFLDTGKDPLKVTEP